MRRHETEHSAASVVDQVNHILQRVVVRRSQPLEYRLANARRYLVGCHDENCDEEERSHALYVLAAEKQPSQYQVERQPHPRAGILIKEYIKKTIVETVHKERQLFIEKYQRVHFLSVYFRRANIMVNEIFSDKNNIILR